MLFRNNLKSLPWILFLCLLTGNTMVYGSESYQNPYLVNRIPESNQRYGSLDLVLRLLELQQAKTLVETGTAREGLKNFEGDGGSTIIFGEWADKHNGSFYSVDLSPQSIASAQEAVNQMKLSSHLVCSDSIAFLTDFGKPIDFLYLDSFDYDWYNPVPCQEHHLKEVIAAYPWLHNNSIIMIDDCSLPHGGKGKLAIKYLEEHGWTTIYSAYQVVLLYSKRNLTHQFQLEKPNKPAVENAQVPATKHAQAPTTGNTQAWITPR